MEGDPAVHLSNLRKRRGTVRKMITRLGNRLPELEAEAGQPDTVEHTKQLIAKLENSSSELKSIHFQVIDLIDAKEESKEQDYLDLIDDEFQYICYLTSPFWWG